MRNQSPKIIAIALLLICFVAAGAMLIWQENQSAPDVRTSAQGMNVEASLSAFRAVQPAFSQENLTVTETSNAGLIVWLAGMPIGILGGFGMGFLYFSRLHSKNANQNLRVSRVLDDTEREESFADVSTSLDTVAQRDSVEGQAVPVTTPSAHSKCRGRFQTLRRNREKSLKRVE